ncbi:polysaccharide ABC transporter ATP-binding protein [Dokdonia sp. Hel_I_53]|uniref:ABC transporter ATP-binding protein n=1 Tax=Dokdonia sp. Hel_I_53 TaxID=1566287 RepID=UPI00119C35CE|nr:ABC transporter ATP-binding protein [Dokdonia sp. Hel_I_53]TVZ53381.1 lipopolysaccharide transport system ATP-binding protein [Dokdonia sp. Hel_I_53]
MEDIILKVENLSKQYRLGTVGTGTLGHDLNRVWHRILGKEDPYLKIGAVNDRSGTTTSEYVWALKDINFEVKRGEILGIIGKNGAGKSTLLKILSRVTSPSTGGIKTKGRIASLLEVGTGMHPELTGLENIYLNGAILGMTKSEIRLKIDEIVEFSGCQMYIDTPVKRYSSGMRVRLGFAVAAFLEPDILVVDEVLAVGDAEFQRKAIGKMQDISNTSERTVLFVSHNMASVQQLCTKSILLINGSIVFTGDTEKAIEKYLSSERIVEDTSYLKQYIKEQDDEIFKLQSLEITQSNTQNKIFYSSSKVEITYIFEIFKETMGLRIGFDLYDTKTGGILWRSYHDDLGSEIMTLPIGNYSFKAIIPRNLLKAGSYALKPIVGIHNNRWIIYEDRLVLGFEIENTKGIDTLFTGERPGVILPAIEWSHE